jgi:hypothetical protein
MQFLVNARLNPTLADLSHSRPRFPSSVSIPARAASRRTPTGTADVYFTPEAPAGQKSNWILTRESKPFFVMFRIHGQQKGAVDGSWLLSDVERVN